MVYRRLLIIFNLFIFSSLNFSRMKATDDFGYISHISPNSGDDIQTLAAKKFLPKNSIAIDREFISQFNHTSPVKTLFYGWYMLTKKIYWYQANKTAPKKSWPPSPTIDPLIISIHLTEKFIPSALTAEGIEYLKQHAPIGARDHSTLKALQQHNIPSYFSGCLTLTLDNPYTSRENIIYAVDIDDECVKFIQSHTTHKVEQLSHRIKSPMKYSSHHQRLEIAENLLEKYKTARCVITSRLHAAMPCLAFKTPVLLINTQSDQYRFDGLRELVHNCSQEDFLSGKINFDFNNPPQNPDSYIPLRKHLIETVTNWVKKNLDSKKILIEPSPTPIKQNHRYLKSLKQRIFNMLNSVRCF